MKRAGIGVAVVLLVVAARTQTRGSDPVPLRAAVVQEATTPEGRGALVYARYGCAMCHGEDGRGGFPNANSETDGKVPGVVFVKEGYTPDELRRLILNGKSTIGRTDANGPQPPFRMPGWSGDMTRPDLDNLVRYLISLYPKDAGEKWR